MQQTSPHGYYAPLADKDVMLLLLKMYIIPRLEYCSAAWNPHKINEIELLESV